MEILRTKSIESLEDKSKGENNENPNPYIRRFGSHIKSHFSQSRCEIFDSSDDEKGSLKNQVGTQMNSMNSMGSMRAGFNKPGENNKSSLQNLDSLKRKDKLKLSNYRLGSTSHIKNNPSIDRGNNHLDLKNQFFKEDNEEQKNNKKFELDLEAPENENKNNLIIEKSRKSSLESLHSMEFDTNNLNEPGAPHINNLQKENTNKIQEEVTPLEKREGFSESSTANNSMFRSGGDKIEEEVQDETNKEGDLDIEN